MPLLSCRFTHERHCRVHLPSTILLTRGFSRQKPQLSSPQIVCLEWTEQKQTEDDGGHHQLQRVYASMHHDLSLMPEGKIGISRHYAHILGISEGEKIKVSPVLDTPSPTTRIEVIPVTSDDWEILSLNAGQIENNLLDQIQILSAGRRFPYWVYGQQLIHLEVRSSLPRGFALLVANHSQIEVIPKPRKDDHVQKLQDKQKMAQPTIAQDDQKNKAFPIVSLRVQPRVRLDSLPPSKKKKVRQERYSYRSRCLLLTSRIIKTLGINHGDLVIVRPCISALTHLQKPSETTLHKKYRSACVLRAYQSPVCAPKHALLPFVVRQELGVSIGSFVEVYSHSSSTQIQPSSSPPLSYGLIPIAWRSPKQSTEEETQSRKQSQQKVHSQRLKALFLKWLRREGPSVPLYEGAILDLTEVKEDWEEDSDNVIPSIVLLSVTWPNEDAKGQKKKTEGSHQASVSSTHPKIDTCKENLFHCATAPASSADPKFPRLWEKDCIDERLRATDDLLDQIPKPLSMTLLSNFCQGDDGKHANAKGGICFGGSLLPGAEEQFSIATEYLATLLLRNRSERMSHLLARNEYTPTGTYNPGGIVLYGGPGVGKTGLAVSIALWLRHHYRGLVTSIRVPCLSLVGLSTQKLEKQLRAVLTKAMHNSPALLILDDLDKLVPAVRRELFEVLQQGRKIIFGLRLHLDSFYDPSDEGASSSRTAILTKIELVVDLLSASMHTARAVFNKRIALLATAKSNKTLPKELQLCAPGLFSRFLEIEFPSAASRRAILKHHLSLSNIQQPNAQSAFKVTLDPSVDLKTFGDKTQGYSPADLYRLSRRVCLAVLASSNKSTLATGCRSIQNVHLETALKDFVPSAIQDLPLTKPTGVRWEHIGGLAGVKATVKETLQMPTEFALLFQQVPIKLRSGLLLYGPPGCGKTLVASAVAQECGLNFVSIKGPELLNKYIGASEEAVRKAFQQAAAASPCVLFLDEFEAIAPKRGGESTGVTDRVVNQFLTLLDGVEGRTGVYVLAATARPDLIDPALLRPGRLDKLLYCGMPTQEERVDIFKALVLKIQASSSGKSIQLGSQLTDEKSRFWHELARKCENYNGADLEAILTTAQLHAVNDLMKSGDSFSSDAGLVLDAQHIMSAFAESSRTLSDSEMNRYLKIYDKYIKGKKVSSLDFDPSAPQRSTLA